MKYFCLLILVLFFLSLSAQNKVTFTYAIKGNDTLKLDVYTPNRIKKSQKLPVLLWMHGGGFSVGSRDYKDDAELCSYAANNGYIGISISYRLLRKGTESGFGCDCSKEDKLETFKQVVIDYLDAAAFVVENAEELKIDTNYIIAGGSSAGAEGTLNAVFMREHFADSLEKYKDVKFAGIFSCAGAVVNADYITEVNAVPSVLFHGTNDQLVPFGVASHHLCNPEKPGYLMLDGSQVIANKLEILEKPYYFNIVKGGRHEVSVIPFSDLDKVFQFFQKTIMNKEIIQTKTIKTKKI
ncbi:alpha/beta hydrolase [Flavobacterium daejeonense]|uniref:alpha/beta hydrolase n=1 Tax=Flavobacterium daejeonense TaxID=350893 RepID=UPI00047976FB|nr:alpha/beta hydrolase [Flavobacterium daejeonense]